MKFSTMFLMHATGSVYEIITGRSHTQRLVKRKIGNLFRKTPKRSWEDGRTNAPRRALQPSAEKCERLNREAARSV